MIPLKYWQRQRQDKKNPRRVCWVQEDDRLDSERWVEQAVSSFIDIMSGDDSCLEWVERDPGHLSN